MQLKEQNERRWETGEESGISFVGEVSGVLPRLFSGESALGELIPNERGIVTISTNGDKNVYPFPAIFN